MIKTIIALVGVLIVVLSFVLIRRLDEGERLAIALDNQETSNAIVEGPPPCTWEANTPERVISENKSEAIVVQVTNDSSEECESILSLRAPGFDLSPPKEEQKINLNSKGKGSLSWILTPRKTGTFEIAVSDMINTKIFGISVTNVFGLGALQAKLFSICGGIFGPMLTVPWWWDRLRLRKPKQENSKEEKVNV